MKVLVADSQKMICDSLQMIVASLPGFEVVGQANSVAAASKLIRDAEGPLTVVSGARLSDGHAVDLIPAKDRAGTAVEFILLIEANGLGHAREALKSGVKSLCLMDDVHEKLPQILAAQSEGVVTLPQPLLQKLLSDDQERLTRREHEIMALLSEGLTNFQISARLGLSENTVKYYLKAIYQKLNVSSRGGAIAKFVAGDY